jgi:hypothetical protein
MAHHRSHHFGLGRNVAVRRHLRRIILVDDELSSRLAMGNDPRTFDEILSKLKRVVSNNSIEVSEVPFWLRVSSPHP